MTTQIHPLLNLDLNKVETAGLFCHSFQLAFGEEGRQTLGGAGGTRKTIA